MIFQLVVRVYRVDKWYAGPYNMYSRSVLIGPYLNGIFSSFPWFSFFRFYEPTYTIKTLLL